MYAWIVSNGGTLIVSAILLAIVARIVIKLVKDKKQGRSCGCSCSNCGMGSSCHQK